MDLEHKVKTRLLNTLIMEENIRILADRRVTKIRSQQAKVIFAKMFLVLKLSLIICPFVIITFSFSFLQYEEKRKIIVHCHLQTYQRQLGSWQLQGISRLPAKFKKSIGVESLIVHCASRSFEKSKLIPKPRVTIWRTN